MTIASIVAAFMGSERASVIASSLPVLCCGTGLIILFILAILFFPRLIKAPGLLMVHVGCAVILLGAIIGGEYSHSLQQEVKDIPQMGRKIRVGKIYKGYMEIPEGEFKSENLGFAHDGLPAVHILPYKVYLEDFDIQFYDSGMVKDYISKVVIITDDGRHLGPYFIEVNKPLHFAGYHFYQSSYTPTHAGYNTILSVVSDDGLWLVYAGFFLLLSGVFWHLWFRPIAQWQLTMQNKAGGADD